MRGGAVFLTLILLLLTVGDTQSSVETHQFTAEVSRLMDILINSLYTQKDVFLRQVISNASDALDKIRFLAITDEKVLGDKREFEIKIQINEEEKFLSITDTGIGMTKAQLMQNLGTIAKSGTTKFVQALKGGSISLIGQFGVGFYSTFLAGYKIEVRSKSPYDDQYVWVSEAASSYKVFKDPEGSTLGRGTQVRIYLKEDSLQFLKHKKVAKVVKKYSQFIDFPIYLLNKKEVEEYPQAATTVVDDVEVVQKQQGADKVKKTVHQWERLNQNKAIWLRDKDQIDDDDYIDFYKILSHQSNPPLNWIHFKAEGEIEFSSVLFLPNRLPFDFFSTYSARKNELKLYVRRVLITENRNQLLPKYLSFVAGVVDSNELPLKVDRETLTQSKAFKVINQKLTKRILDMITEISKWNEVDNDEDQFQQEDSENSQQVSETQMKQRREKQHQRQIQENKKKYMRFYVEFGKAIKLGVIEDSTNRKKLASLTRWHSTWNSTEFISLDDYITRMKKAQDQIYFFSGEDKSVLERSPLVKGLVRKGYQVLLCNDPIDEYVFNTLREYDDKNIVNVGKGDFKLPDDDETQRKKQKYIAQMYKPYIDYAKKTLFEKVGNVIISNRLSTEPCVVVADSYGQSSFMQKIQKSQMLSSEGQNPTSTIKKILEINPHHRVNQILLKKIQDGETDETIEQLVQTLYQTAALQSGFALSDPNAYSKRFYQIYSQALGVLNLERNQDIQIEDDIELQQKDYEGGNEQVMRLNPNQMRGSAVQDE